MVRLCLGLEIMGPAYRTFAGMMLCLVFAVALMILAGELVWNEKTTNKNGIAKLCTSGSREKKNVAISNLTL
jgi:hypothetical protein